VSVTPPILTTGAAVRPAETRDDSLASSNHGGIAQLVEHTTENRGVPGSSPGLAISQTHTRDFPWAGPGSSPGLAHLLGCNPTGQGWFRVTGEDMKFRPLAGISEQPARL
jgi:hypothetical protein